MDSNHHLLAAVQPIIGFIESNLTLILFVLRFGIHFYRMKDESFGKGMLHRIGLKSS